ncbi:MAG TPA: ring-cleaving dioxygenase [Chthoniobacterales bacterium]
MNISGLHHVTAIASDPQRNLDFYAGLLGLRLVKRTVNFDDPGSYHFYFGDAVGTPGTILTFFPWPHARRGIHGSGETEANAFAIPENAVSYWLERLRAHRVNASTSERFGETVIRFEDPDGLPIELIATPTSDQIQPWTDGGVPAECTIRGLHGITAISHHPDATAQLLTETFGYRLTQKSGDRTRFETAASGAPGTVIDLLARPDLGPARPAAGSVHHIAFRAANDAQHVAWQNKVATLGYGVSPVMDRTYFRSIYFREPGGVLFEIATDQPGFATDESRAELGTTLRLPSWMESSRPRIEDILPKITLPAKI